MAKLRTVTKKIGEHEIESKDTSKGVSFCVTDGCDGVVKDYEYFEQAGRCLECYRGFSFDPKKESEEKSCNECKSPMTDYKYFINEGVCYSCLEKKFKEEFPEFPI